VKTIVFSKIKNIIQRNKFFEGLLFFEIVFALHKNQRTMARELKEVLFFKNLGLH
jgi:hypothetical protein